MSAVIERIETLEQTVQDFVRNADIQFDKLRRSQLRTEMEMRELRTELRESQKKLEESHRRTEKELREFKEEGHRRFRGMNKKWGKLSNKLGTLVEDLVAPSLPRIIEQRLDKHVYSLMVRGPSVGCPTGG